MSGWLVRQCLPVEETSTHRGGRDPGGALDQGVARLQIAAERLTFVDSSGIKTLLDMRHRASERESVVEVVSASKRLRWVVKVTGVHGLLPAGG
jgi:hypothetical protein